MAEASSQTKYERLALEYSKLRSNATVLKKAVLEEKESNIKLTERLKASDMAQRKHEQELDSLRFRNQQLVKRVEVLQNDLDAALASNGKKKNNQNLARTRVASSPVEMKGQPDHDVIMEQLQKTIDENARLVIELAESKRTREETIAENKRQCDEMVKTAREELNKSQSSLQADRDTAVANCSMLQDEKMTLENQLIAKEASLQQRIAENNQLREKVENLRSGLLVPTPGDLPEKITQPIEPQELLPSTKEALEHCLRLVRGLKEWHENDIVRLSAPLGPLRASPELTETMEKCSIAANTLEQELDSTVKLMKEQKPKLTEEGIQRLKIAFVDYVERMNVGIPAAVKRIEDECALSFCPPTLVKRNTEIMSSLKEFVSIVTELQERFCNGKCDRNLAEVAGELKQAGREMARLFNCKVSLETKTAEIPEQVKTANEAMVHGLLVARSAIDKLAPILSDNIFSPAAVRLLQELLLGDSVTNGTRTPNSETSVSSSADDAQRLQRELTNLKAALKESEQARDSIGLEAQLERMRREKEVQRRAELERQVAILRSQCDGDVTTADNVSDPLPVVPAPHSDMEREKVIVDYYQDIVGNLQQQLYQLTSVAENQTVEAENIRAQWAMALKQCETLDQEVSRLKANTRGITEDLDSTRRNYESQLSTLTEHIADMNDKLIERQENIVDLRRQLENKSEFPLDGDAFLNRNIFNRIVTATKRK